MVAREVPEGCMSTITATMLITTAAETAAAALSVSSGALVVAIRRTPQTSN